MSGRPAPGSTGVLVFLRFGFESQNCSVSVTCLFSERTDDFPVLVSDACPRSRHALVPASQAGGPPGHLRGAPRCSCPEGRGQRREQLTGGTPWGRAEAQGRLQSSVVRAASASLTGWGKCAGRAPAARGLPAPRAPARTRPRTDHAAATARGPRRHRAAWSASCRVSTPEGLLGLPVCGSAGLPPVPSAPPRKGKRPCFPEGAFGGMASRHLDGQRLNRCQWRVACAGQAHRLCASRTPLCLTLAGLEDFSQDAVLASHQPGAGAAG